jgi:hypothetical protein
VEGINELIPRLAGWSKTKLNLVEWIISQQKKETGKWGAYPSASPLM